jgi:hypothetical protein
MSKWTNIFKTGTHTDSSGRTRTWTDGDLDRITGNYNQRTEDAPVVFGHPKGNDPAQGWIKEVKNEDGILQAQFAQVSDTAREAMDNGGYKYGSLSLTPELKIRHFGLLGAVPPAIKGLGRVEFQDEGGLTVDINFNEPDIPADPPGKPAPEDPDMTKELEDKLAKAEKNAADEKTAREKAEADLKAKDEETVKQEAERRTADTTAKVDKLVEDGKLLPADKPKVLAFCEALDGEDGSKEMSFSADEGKKPLTDHFLNFMAEAKGHGLLNEFNAPSDNDDAVTDDLTQYV